MNILLQIVCRAIQVMICHKLKLFSKNANELLFHMCAYMLNSPLKNTGLHGVNVPPVHPPESAPAGIL